MRKKSNKSSRIAEARRNQRVATGLYFPEKFWLVNKPYNTFGETDTFYFELANKVYLALQTEKTYILGSILSENYIPILACHLTTYFEDKMSEVGLWRAFIDSNKALYGYSLPFYNLDNYDSKGINIQDIQYLLWHRLSVDKSEFLAPTREWIFVLAQNIFDIFEKAQHKAEKNTAYEKYLSISDDIDLYHTRFTLQWIATQSYLMGADLLHQFQKDFKQAVDNNNLGLKKKGHIYHTLMEDYGYSRRSSFSALSAPEILYRIADASDKTKENIKTLSRHIGLYRYKGTEAEHLIFEHVQTSRVYKVIKESIKENSNHPFLLGHSFFMSLILWQDEWWLTGMMRGGKMDQNGLEKIKYKPLTDIALWSDQQKEQAIQIQKEQYDVFIETFGKALVQFDSKETYNEEMIRFQINLKKKIKKLEQLNEEEIAQIKELVHSSSNQLTEFRFSIFFSTKAGMKMVYNIPYIIDLMEKPMLANHEKEDLFACFLEDKMPLELLQFLLANYSTQHLESSPEVFLFDVPKHLHFLRRFYHPIDFGQEAELPTVKFKRAAIAQ